MHPPSKKTTELYKRIMPDFKTSRGELIQPFEVLKVTPESNRKEIKLSYYELSKTYHPDGGNYCKRGILPGKW